MIILPVNAFPVGIQIGLVLKSWNLIIEGNTLRFRIGTKRPNKTMVGHLMTKGFNVRIDPNAPPGLFYSPKDYLLGNKIVNALLVFGKAELNGAVFRYNGDGTVSTDSAQTMEDAIYAESGGF